MLDVKSGARHKVIRKSQTANRRDKVIMKRHFTVIAAGMAALVIAPAITTPILAQRNSDNRPSRQCIKEVVKLCGRNRSEIPACLQTKSSQLSSKCQDDLAQRMEQRYKQRQRDTFSFQRTATPTSSIVYGNHQRQQVDIYEPKDIVEDRPLILFIHGGGWRRGSHKMIDGKAQYIGGKGLYFASAGYRVLPDSPVEEQAQDIGLALQALIKQSDTIGFDANQIVLMGHSAGAHLAALVSTDPQYAGDAFNAIKGVVLIDGAGYDVAKNMANDWPGVKGIYEGAFGLDPKRQKALSAVTHIGGADAPNWLALYVKQRAPSREQAKLLTDGLNKQGQSAKAVAIAGTDHMGINRELGAAGKPQTDAVDAFLAKVLN